MKECLTCGEVKKLSDFHKCGFRKGKHLTRPRCKTCIAKERKNKLSKCKNKNCEKTIYEKSENGYCFVCYGLRNVFNPNSEKKCFGCGIIKNVSEFNKRFHKQKMRIRSRCKKCELDYAKKYYEKLEQKEIKNRKLKARKKQKIKKTNDPIYKLRLEKQSIKRSCKVFGFSDYLCYLISSIYVNNSKCGICGVNRNILNRRLHVDHCHETGKFRGFLCSKCNTGLGQFRDNIEFLEKAIRYLKTSGIGPICAEKM